MSNPRDANTAVTPCEEGDSFFKLVNGLEVVILSDDFEKAAEREFEESFEYVDVDVAAASTTTSLVAAGDLSNAEDFVVIGKGDADQEREDRLKAQKLAIAEEEVKVRTLLPLCQLQN
jgi:hypothetical protein